MIEKLIILQYTTLLVFAVVYGLTYYHPQIFKRKKDININLVLMAIPFLGILLEMAVIWSFSKEFVVAIYKTLQKKV